MIVRGTTPTIRFTFIAVDTADIVVAYLTIMQNGATQMLDGEMGIFEIVRC